MARPRCCLSNCSCSSEPSPDQRSLAHSCAHLLEHATALALDRTTTARRDRDDRAQADACVLASPYGHADTLAVFRYQGHIGAALVLGGYDATGPHLFTIAPHGSTDKLPYVTMGSGSLAAMAVFESFWRADMTRADAIELVCQAIEAGIFNDLGCVLTASRRWDAMVAR